MRKKEAGNPEIRRKAMFQALRISGAYTAFGLLWIAVSSQWAARALGSPGMAFLLATIQAYGDKWTGYWEDLRDNGLEVTSGWDEAYNGSFAAGSGERTIVTSYATS